MTPYIHRADFYREARTLSRLRDENVVQLIGVCTQWVGVAGSFSIVTEYMRHGDLKCFLLRHNAVWLNAVTAGVHARTLRSVELVGAYRLKTDKLVDYVIYIFISFITSIHTNWSEETEQAARITCTARFQPYGLSDRTGIYVIPEIGGIMAFW